MYRRFVKRGLDILLSALALILLSPVFALLALLVRLKLGAPVLFRQERPGLKGKIFKMYKFRTMLDPQTRDGRKLSDRERLECVEKSIDILTDEERLTRFGRLLRAASLDELPELWNILIGDMSIVGPRPAAVDQVDITRGGRFAAAGEVTSGLTGPSALYDYLYGDQIESEEEYVRDVLPTRLELDLVYLDKRGVGFDLKMIWWTVVCIVYQIAGRTPEKLFNTLLKWAAEHKEEPVCAAN